MPPVPRTQLLGVTVHPTNYAAAVEDIVHAAKAKRSFTCTALAVHGLMTGALNPPQRARLNTFNLVTPDGQPVRWALNAIYRAGLRDRVYGPFLMQRVCARAGSEGLRVFFYGSEPETLAQMSDRLRREIPALQIVGTCPSRFRRATEAEWLEDVAAIRATQPDLVFCGLGCPRQEIWVYEMREYISAPLIAVGAAFPLLAGSLAMAPAWMQRAGLEWFFRLTCEPRRLWQRYLLLNPLFVSGIFLQKLGLHLNQPTVGEPVLPAERWS